MANFRVLYEEDGKQYKFSPSDFKKEAGKYISDRNKNSKKDSREMLRMKNILRKSFLK